MKVLSNLLLKWTVKTYDDINAKLNQVVCNNETQRLEHIATDTDFLTRYLHNNIYIPANDSISVEFGFNGRVAWLVTDKMVDIKLTYAGGTEALLKNITLFLIEGFLYESIDIVNDNANIINGKLLILGDEDETSSSSSSS